MTDFPAMHPTERALPPDVFIRGVNVLDETGGFAGPLDVVVDRGVVLAVGRDL